MKKIRSDELPTYKSWKELPHVPVSLGVVGSIGATGEWRIVRPTISREKCNRCGLCYIHCPEGTMIFAGGGDPEVNLTYCKGCGICAAECPRKAISMKSETAERKNKKRNE
jgi:pyruvate ferredoxin oxidoreductase delta subunit